MKKRPLYKLYLTGALVSTIILSSCKKEKPAPLPFADFFVSNSGCVSPCWVHFYDNSTNAVKWEWNFGNGFNSTTQNDSMLYDETGLYDVELKVWNIDDSIDQVVKMVQVY